MEIDIPKAISALSVLFGVAVFHMGVSNKEILSTLSTEIAPKLQNKERRSQKQKVLNTFFFRGLPSFLMLSSIIWVMSPNFFYNIFMYDFELWKFDFMVTLYQLIWIIVFFYFVLSVLNVFKLLMKFRKF